MKRILGISLILLAGCATPGINTQEFRKDIASKHSFPQNTHEDFVNRRIKLGMNKEQIFWLCGSPLTWSKHPAPEGIFETWSYSVPQGDLSERITTFDFKDGILVGYSGNGRYISQNKTEDLREFVQ